MARKHRDRGGEPDVAMTGEALGGDVARTAESDVGVEVVRSEEELRVSREWAERGRVRLRKYVTTEQVTQKVPVQREEARIEREPITDANVEPAMSGPEISEAEHEVTLHAEEPVVEKRAVPKERVRLDKDVETDEETVSEEVRKERIEPEGDPRDRPA